VKTPLLFLALLLAAASALAADITGTITCKGKGVQGVVVSDGHSFATTDKQGVYRLQSDKRNGYVFYVIPSGYMPLTEKGNWEEKLFGGFWRTLSFPDDSNMDEQHDFMLQKEKNDKHIMVFEADPQLANRKYTKDNSNNKNNRNNGKGNRQDRKPKKEGLNLSGLAKFMH
jgi:hypothetical protein